MRTLRIIFGLSLGLLVAGCAPNQSARSLQPSPVRYGFGGGGGSAQNGGSPTDWFNVKTQYGAKGDGKVFYAGAMDNNSTFNLTDTTNAPFTSADVGKLICVGGAGASTIDACGTISSITSSSVAVLSFKNISGSSISSKQYQYASDDTAAINAAEAAAIAAKGGTVYFPVANYGVSAQISYNLTYGVNFIGGGSTLGNWHYATPNSSGNGASLWFLAAGKNTSAFELLTSSTWIQNSSIENLSFMAGANDLNRSGWGGDGVELNTIQHINMYNVNISNFNGNCLLIDGTSPGVEVFESVRIQYCGFNGNGSPLDAVRINSSTVQNVRFSESELQDAQGCGLNIVAWGNFAANISLINSIVQNNDRKGGTNASILCAAAQLNGQLTLIGNWFDTGSQGSLIRSAQQANFAGTSFMGNYQDQNTGAPNPLLFSVAGTALPSCTTQLAHAGPVCTSDATACTIGTTYAGSGTTLCAVQCDGTNWKETGSSVGCN